MKKALKDKTIVDIANKLNISIATVSRALSDFPYVKESTRLRVHQMAKEIGYQRNVLASGLRSNKTNTIGLIVPRVSMYFHSVVITTVQNALYKMGYNLLICQSNDNPEIEKQLIATLYNSRVDAVIVSCTLFTEDFSPFDKIVSAGIPLIFYDRVPTINYPALSVVGDEYTGGYLAMKHLIDQGCKCIAYVSGPQNCYLYKKRTEGALDALKDNKMKLVKDNFIVNNLTYEEGILAMDKLFANKNKNKPDGIFMSNDTSAIAALEYCREHKISVPASLKIVGYSNDPRSAITSPAISTVDQNPELVGNRIVTELISLLKTGRTTEVTEANDLILQYPNPMVVPINFIQRYSS